MNRNGLFGHWLRQRRKTLDLTQADLAAQLGCSTVTIRKIEADERRPSKQIAERMADVLAIASEERASFIHFARRVSTPIKDMLVDLAGTSRNLPPQSTPFIGRENELAQIADYLADPTCRLLTLVGAGGMGKTRLAIEVAKTVTSSNYPNGIYFVELQPITDSELIVTAIAHALGMNFSGQDTPRSQLLNYLQTRYTLLLIDNFEHLLNGVDLLSDIVMSAPGVKLLVTSREALNVQEEWLWQVGGLQVPGDADKQHIEDYSAVQMFVSRARRARADFSLDGQASHIARICQFVEGMPLALELAAGWVNALSCAEIADEIQHNLNFLTSSLRNAPERHRNMQAVFEQSWHLLTDDERAVFPRLSVFRGGFMREAAEQVAGASLTVLSGLVDKSFVRMDATGRYDIHELMRQYGEEKLTQVGENDAIHAAHCAYFARFMRQHEEGIKSHDLLRALNEIDADFENVRLMWQRAVSQQNHDAVNQAMESLYLFNVMRGSFHDHQALFDEACKQFAPCDGEAPSSTWGRVLVREHWFQGSFRTEDSQSLTRVEIARQIALREGNLAEIALCLYISGHLITQNDPTEAIRRFQESLLHYEAMEEIFYRLHLLQAIAYCYPLINQLQMAIASWHQSLEISRQHHIQSAMGHCLGPLGHAEALGEGDYALGTSYVQEAVNIYRDLGFRGETARYARWLSCLVFFQGDFDRARALAEEARDIAYDLHEFELLGVTQSILGMLANLKGDYRVGMELCQQGLQYSASKLVLSLANWALGWVYCGVGDMRRANRHLYAALQAVVGLPFPGYVLCCLPIAALIQANDPERAAALLGLAFSHPKSATGWLERWPLITQLRTELEVRLGVVVYGAAWERGKNLDLETVIAEIMAQYDVERETPDSNRVLVDPLTRRELEVLRLIAAGYSNPQIAHDLILAVGTVKFYTHSVYSKLSVASRTQAIARARELGLI